MSKNIDISEFYGNLKIDDVINRVSFEPYKGDKFPSYYSQLTKPIEDKEVCPECGDEITRNGRCRTCYSCGWSSCDL